MCIHSTWKIRMKGVRKRVVDYVYLLRDVRDPTYNFILFYFFFAILHFILIFFLLDHCIMVALFLWKSWSFVMQVISADISFTYASMQIYWKSGVYMCEWFLFLFFFVFSFKYELIKFRDYPNEENWYFILFIF